MRSFLNQFRVARRCLQLLVVLALIGCGQAVAAEVVDFVHDALERGAVLVVVLAP
jgi:hypothetical protein